MKTTTMAGSLLAAALMLLPAATVWASFEDPINSAALPNARAVSSPLIGVSVKDGRIVAVGQRGVIIVSEDGGANWTQATVPARTDLLAVHFPSAMKGWAVGHGGVVLHSEDGGRSWVKQLDGHSASTLIIEHYSKLGDEGADYVERERNLADFGGTQPLMSVYFEDDLRGYVVGTFNRILRTEDGGKSWTPLSHRVENPEELHFYAIARGEAGLFMVGEQGMVWKYDPGSDRFVAHPTGYEGTLFGAVVGTNVVIAHGMRGSVYRSTDGGMHWERVEVSGHAGVPGGVRLTDERILLGNLAGAVLNGGLDSARFETLRASQPMSYYDTALLDDQRLVLVGAEGVRIQSIAELQRVAADESPR